MKAITILAAFLLVFSACEFERSSLLDDAELAVNQPDTLFNLHETAIGYGSITLEWNVVPDAVNYRYFRALSDDFTTTGPIAVAGTTYTDTSLMPNTKYFFMVCASYSDGGEDCSKVFIARTASLPVPTNLQASATETSVSLSWDTIDGVSSYVIHRGPDNVTYTASGTGFVDNSVTAGSTYTYYVTCMVSPYGEGPASNTVQAQIPLPSPGGLAVASKTSTTINLTWNAVGGAARYRLYRDGVQIADLTTTHFSDWGGAGLTPGTSYAYAVSAVTGGNSESGKSAALNVTTASDIFGTLGYSLIIGRTWSTSPIYGSNTGNQLPVGTIVFFRTRSGLYGKLEVQQFDYTISDDIILRIVTYDAGGVQLFSDRYFIVRGTFSANLNDGSETIDEGTADFKWVIESPTVRYIDPLPSGSPITVFSIY